MENDKYFLFSPFNFPLSTSTSCYTNVPSVMVGTLVETTPDKEYIVYSDRNLRFTWSQFNRRVDDILKDLSPSAWNGEHT